MFLALAGCDSPSEHQRMYLVEGERAFRDKQYERAASQLSLFLTEVKDRPEAARALYVRGMARALSGQRASAYADLRKAAAESADPQITRQAQAVLGILYFEDESWDLSAKALATATQRMPSAPPKDALLFRIGLCQERAGRWAAALAAYRQIVGELPRGMYAEAAERRLQLQADHFAVQCGVFLQAENANQLASRLQREGLRTYVRQEQRKGTSCYVVLEGRYNSYQEGTRALARVRGYVPEAVLWP
jgi:tetratricopeptide (TPR) repeat protein